MKEVIEKARKWALEEIKRNGLPSLINFNLSNEKGQELANKFGVDKDIVMLGTVLMDIKIGECFKEGKIQEHVKRGSEAVQKFLKNFDLNNGVKKKIIGCVEAHHGKNRFICKEAEICANADCYRFIYPKNVFAFIVENTKQGMTFEESLKFAYEKLEEKHKILSLDICKNELELYYQNFKELFKNALELNTK